MCIVSRRTWVRIPPKSPVNFFSQTRKALSMRCYTHVGVGQNLIRLWFLPDATILSTCKVACAVFDRTTSLFGLRGQSHQGYSNLNPRCILPDIYDCLGSTLGDNDPFSIRGRTRVGTMWGRGTEIKGGIWRGLMSPSTPWICHCLQF